MTQKQAIQLFEDRKVRTVWDERTETWYFSVLDVISALTDTVNPTDYFKKMRKRDEALASFVGTNCPQIAMRSETGVMRKTLAADVKTVLRIIQSIPSQKMLCCGILLMFSLLQRLKICWGTNWGRNFAGQKKKRANIESLFIPYRRFRFPKI